MRSTSVAFVVLLAACDRFYVASARVPLAAPLDSGCLAKLGGPGNGLRHRDATERSFGQSSARVVSYSSDAMFHDRWQVFEQQTVRDTSVFRGVVYRDSSAWLATAAVRVNRRFLPAEGPSIVAEMARGLTKIRDECGGRGEPLAELFVSDAPYRAWIVRGTAGHVAVRITADGLGYTLLAPHVDHYVLHVDTLADRSEAGYPVWLEARRADLSPAPSHAELATECWRGDTLGGRVVAFVHDDYDHAYLPAEAHAWAIDPSTRAIAEIPAADVECRNAAARGLIPDAPRVLRAAALAFQPARGSARLYAYVTGGGGNDPIVRVSVDSEEVGRADSGGFLMVELEPGRHALSFRSAGGTTELALDAASDSSYFLDLHWKTLTSLRPRAVPRIVSDSIGRAAVRSARMVPSSWPGTRLADH